MKKLFFSLMIAGTLASCDNAADSTANAQDSIDSIASEKKDAIDSSAEAKKDMVDSTAEQKKEALDRLDSLNKADSVTKK
jgi:hypothetical protein